MKVLAEAARRELTGVPWSISSWYEVTGCPPSNGLAARAIVKEDSVELTYRGAAEGAYGTVAGLMMAIGDQAPGPLTLIPRYLKAYSWP